MYSNFVLVQIYGFVSTTEENINGSKTYVKYNKIKGAVNYFGGGTENEHVFGQVQNHNFTAELQSMLDEYTETFGNIVGTITMKVEIRKLKTEV